MKKTYLYKTILLFTVTFTATQVSLAASRYPMEQPTYKTQKSAQTAIRTAAREAGKIDPALNKALHSLQTAEYESKESNMPAPTKNIAHPETMLHNAEKSYTAMLSEMSGVSEDDLRKMHSAGISWEELPGELGLQTAVTPMMNGEGLQKNHNGQGAMISTENSMEMQAVTARNMETGGVIGHGRGLQTNVASGTHGNMMSGAGGLNNGMGDMEAESHDNDMSGGMGGSSGGMGGSSGSGGGMGSSGGMGGGMGGGGMGGGGMN